MSTRTLLFTLAVCFGALAFLIYFPGDPSSQGRDNLLRQWVGMFLAGCAGSTLSLAWMSKWR